MSGDNLKAITLNGAILVESAEDIAKREERRKKRKSRWGSQTVTCATNAATPSGLPAAKRSNILLPLEDKSCEADNTTASASSTIAINMPTSIDASKMDESEQKMYLLKMKIQESTVRLARKDLGIPANPRDRSPSPEPVYNNKGVRINTREDRTRSKLINQRNDAITKLKELDPTYQPPSHYRYKNTQLEDRVYIPADVRIDLFRDMRYMPRIASQSIFPRLFLPRIRPTTVQRVPVFVKLFYNFRDIKKNDRVTRQISFFLSASDNFFTERN